MIESQADVQRTFAGSGEPGVAELCDRLRALLHGADPRARVVALRRLKARVYRLELSDGAPWRSVVLKRLEPAVAQRTRLLAHQWLPALGLGDRCARLLAEAAEQSGSCVWHIYEDLGDETLAARPDRERVEATLNCLAELHRRAARHPVLPDVRRYGADLGMNFFVANVRDALAALDALAAAGIETPPAHAQVTARLRERLHQLLADAPLRAQAFESAAGPDTLLHGDLWTINVFVGLTSEGLRARLVDWDRVGVGPFSYDLSTLLFRFPPEERSWMLSCYRRAVARAGERLAPLSDLQLLFDTAERSRYANRIIWPALALLQGPADWGFPELAEVERWFVALDAGAAGTRPAARGPRRPAGPRRAGAGG